MKLPVATNQQTDRRTGIITYDVVREMVAEALLEATASYPFSVVDALLLVPEAEDMLFREPCTPPPPPPAPSISVQRPREEGERLSDQRPATALIRGGGRGGESRPSIRELRIDWRREEETGDGRRAEVAA